MAHNDVENKQKNPQSFADAVRQAVQEDLANQERERKRIARERNMDDFCKRIDELGKRAIKFEDDFGRDDYRTQMLVMYLELALQMKSAIELITDVVTAMECIGRAVDCIDSVMDMQQDILAASLLHNYSFRDRMRRKRMLRKALRNNMGRLKQMTVTLTQSHRFATDITQAMETACYKMKSVTERSLAKSQKRRRKQGISPATENSNARRFMDMLRDESGDNPPVTPASGAAGSISDDPLDGIA